MICLIYHYWNDEIEDVLFDKFNPILCSIAMLRSVNDNIDVLVLDRSEKNHNWSKYENLLNFSVVKIKKRFKKNKGYCSDSFSRIFDITDVLLYKKCETILFNDTDVFWINDPLPLFNFQNPVNKKYFNCNKNNGVFYFNVEEKCNFRK